MLYRHALLNSQADLLIDLGSQNLRQDFSSQNKLSSDLSDGRSRFHAEIINRRANNFPPPALSGPKRTWLPLSQPPQRSAAQHQ
jgi:hypothetical protein